MPCDMQDNGWGEFFAPYQEAAANATDIVTITLGGQQHKLTVHDVSQLSMHQFAKIWTVRPLLHLAAELFVFL